MSNYDIVLEELRKAGSYEDPDVEDTNYADKFRAVGLPMLKLGKPSRVLVC
jgi:hypothetical protein